MSIEMTDKDLSILARMIDNAPIPPAGKSYIVAIRNARGTISATLYSDNSVTITQENDQPAP